MKKNYFFTLLLTVICGFTSFGQTTVFAESFETGNAGTPSETCNDGFDFFTRAKNDGTELGASYEVSGQDGDYIFAAMDTDGAPCTMATQTLFFDNVNIATYSNLTLAILLAEDQPSDGKFDWDGGDLFYIEVDYDNSGTFTKVLQFGTTATTGFNISAPMQDTDLDGIGDGTALSATFSEFTTSLGTGNVVDIRLVFDKLGSGDEDIAIDNIRIIDGFVAEPSLTITGATDNRVFNPSTTEVSLGFDVNNFTLSGDNGSGMSDGTGDGVIKTVLQISGEADEIADFFTTTPPAIEVTPGKTYTATAELVDNTGASLSPKVESTVTFSVASYTDVNSISQLRAGTEGEYYNLSGDNVTLTYSRSFRGQKYIQDQTGGILIDDTAGAITTTYNQFDVLPGLKGKLSSFGGILQFLPDVDPGASTSTNNLIPEVVTLTDFVANFADYESELIKIEDISFDAADVGTDFASSTSYDISSGAAMSIFRTNFFEADYIDTAIPSGVISMNVLGGAFDGVGQITAINLADLVLSLIKNTIEGFATYPNPVTNNSFTIKSSNAYKKVVTIYNVLGKKVLSTSFSGIKSDIDVSSISSGLYILKVTEGNKIATSKLVIK